MGRGGVFIGVDQTGGLQRLNDAARGAQRMHAWAVQQGMPDGTHAELITDAAGKVTLESDLRRQSMPSLRGAGVDQLILYFAGHGVNINRNEFWLLTGCSTENECCDQRQRRRSSWRATAASNTSSSSPTPAGLRRPGSKHRASTASTPSPTTRRRRQGKTSRPVLCLLPR